MGSVANTVKNGVSKSMKGMGQCPMSQKWSRNASSNLHQCAQTAPGITQIKDFGQGIAQGDFQKVVLNGSILGLSTVGSGSQKVVSLSNSSHIARAAALCTTDQLLKTDVSLNGTRGFAATVRHQAPAFSGMSYWDGEFKPISLDDFKGKYVVLFFYPADFTFVCPTEIIQFSDMAKDFANSNCQVIGCSTDTHFCHAEWTKKDRKKGGLGKMDIPLLGDQSLQIAKDYGALCDGDAAGLALRGTYIIDGKGKLVHMSQNDLPVGRSAPEVLRLVQAFQHVEEHGEVCPASWKKGAATMDPDFDSKKTIDYFENANK